MLLDFLFGLCPCCNACCPPTQVFPFLQFSSTQLYLPQKTFPFCTSPTLHWCPKHPSFVFSQHFGHVCLWKHLPLLFNVYLLHQTIIFHQCRASTFRLPSQGFSHGQSYLADFKAVVFLRSLLRKGLYIPKQVYLVSPPQRSRWKLKSVFIFIASHPIL